MTSGSDSALDLPVADGSDLAMGMDDGASNVMSVESGDVSDDAADAATTMAESAMMGSQMSDGAATITLSSKPIVSWLSSKAMIWCCLALGFALALIAFVLSLVIYFRERADHRHVREAFCKSRKCCCELKTEIADLTARVVENEFNSQSVLGEWSWTETALTGTTAMQSMLLATATPQPTAPTIDAQVATSSVLPAPFAGTLTALTVESGAVPSAGSATFVVTINGVSTLLSASLLSTSTTPFATATGSLAFAAGDLIGVAFTTTGITLASPPTFTAQLFANFVA